jgi:thymidine kinase
MGPMWSGKTDVLIRRITDFTGRTIMAFKPKADTRNDDISSRAGLHYPCKKIEDHELCRLIRFADDGCVIVIDEGQFFGPQLLEVAERFVVSESILVICGLELTSEQETFGQLIAISDLAQRVTYVRARCAVCSKPAAYTYSRVPKDGKVRVGSEGYEPRCLEHWSIMS